MSLQSVTRSLLFAAPILFLLCPASVAEAQRPTDFSSLQVVTTQVAGNIYMLQSPVSGNTAALIGSDGVLLVDAQYAPIHAKLMAAVRKLSPQPLRFLINTHFHRDHSEGNVHMTEEGAVIIAHENVRTFLANCTSTIKGEDGFVYSGCGRKTDTGAAVLLPPLPGLLPTVTYTGALTMYFNGEEIHLTHLEAAHTNADSVVYFRKANVMHTGDIIDLKQYPAPETIDGWMAAVDQIIKIGNPATKFIPGHGELGTFDDVVNYYGTVFTIRSRVLNGIREGQTLQQVIASKPTAEFDRRYNGRPGEGLVTTIYQQLSKK